MTVAEQENPYPVGPNGPVYLTTAEVAERFRTAESTVRYWRHRGEGPLGVQFQGRVLYPLPAVEAWETAQIEQAERDQRRRANPLSSVPSAARGSDRPRRTTTSPATRPANPVRKPGRSAASSASTTTHRK